MADAKCADCGAKGAYENELPKCSEHLTHDDDCHECRRIDDLCLTVLADSEYGDGLTCDDCEAAREDGPSPEEEDFLGDRVGFADPGGRSALRAATESNPRIHPCPTCGAPDRLTPADVSAGYQCDGCADAAEGY